jgi:hypothetical protein
MDLESWLRSLGLERYEPIFRENAIDADLLHDLTEDHLREMGLPLGARLKLRKAINALVPGAKPIGPALTVAPSGPPADTAERRQITVMFSDLVVLRQKTRRLFLLNLLTQYGHLGSILAIATIKR